MHEGGWLASGDLGEVDEAGYVRITGRKKDLVITSSGKNISPERSSARCARRLDLAGDRRRRPALVPRRARDARPDDAPRLAAELGVASDPPAMAEDDRVRAIEADIQAVNQRFATIEQIKLRDPAARPSQADGELTPTLKVKRGGHERYAGRSTACTGLTQTSATRGSHSRSRSRGSSRTPPGAPPRRDRAARGRHSARLMAERRQLAGREAGEVLGDLGVRGGRSRPARSTRRALQVERPAGRDHHQAQRVALVDDVPAPSPRIHERVFHARDSSTSGHDAFTAAHALINGGCRQAACSSAKRGRKAPAREPPAGATASSSALVPSTSTRSSPASAASGSSPAVARQSLSTTASRSAGSDASSRARCAARARGRSALAAQREQLVDERGRARSPWPAAPARRRRRRSRCSSRSARHDAADAIAASRRRGRASSRCGRQQAQRAPRRPAAGDEVLGAARAPAGALERALEVEVAPSAADHEPAVIAGAPGAEPAAAHEHARGEPARLRAQRGIGRGARSASSATAASGSARRSSERALVELADGRRDAGQARVRARQLRRAERAAAALAHDPAPPRRSGRARRGAAAAVRVFPSWRSAPARSPGRLLAASSSSQAPGQRRDRGVRERSSPSPRSRQLALEPHEVDRAAHRRAHPHLRVLALAAPAQRRAAVGPGQPPHDLLLGPASW
jgi:hypothetical protein